ncbi:hypothetical protein [Aquimarina sp. 2201CG14-23]|uniref:hypothetical protein n=1 Tax=Aquimarina mycalae TaxID=3040073 RepID=UPI002477D338|nr:hypothetical protein [Aquimarina sp. 2201CG14-23]MDH7444951.1 hypothetical protein [Aquimarina sp. 2201CG14-23]
MESYIEKWIWIVGNDSALEFVYFIERLGAHVSFSDIYKYCDLQEKLKIRNSITTSETCEKLAINYTWKNDKIEDSSLFADAILTLSLIIIDCNNNGGSSDLTVFTGAEKTITIEYDKDSIETLIDSLGLLNTYLMKFFGFNFYEEDDNETKEAKVAIIEIKKELEKILNKTWHNKE